MLSNATPQVIRAFDPSQQVSGVVDKPNEYDGLALIIPAILDEAAVTLKANGIALIKFDSNRSDLMVENGRLGWVEWSGNRFRPLGNIIHLISSIGQIDIDSVSSSIIPISLRDQTPQVRYLAFAPLFYNGFNLGALWVGLEEKLATTDIVQLGSVGEVVADVIYNMSRETQTAITPMEIIQVLVRLMNTWDPATYENSVREVTWARSTARRLGLSDATIQATGWAALLHDIGYIGISKTLLRKPGKLTEEDWQHIRRHPIIGSNMIPQHGELGEVSSAILTHHERFDGKGYPKGMIGKEIPITGRIVALADAYGAMTSERSYRPVLSHDEAVSEILAWSGRQFDPDAARAFLENFH